MPSTPLFGPGEFFAQRSPSLASASIILLFTGVVAVASAAPYVDQVTSVEITTETLVISILLGGLIGAAGIWIVSTVIVYLLTAIVGGNGSITQTAANIGWALLPLLFVNTISTITLWSVAFTGNSPSMTVTQMQLPPWLLLFNTVVGLIGYVWVGYILTYAIKHARNIDIRRSAGVAGIVVAIPVLNAVIGLF